ncbi:MAG: cytochrome c biogenesis protein CcdA [Rikenellaceae bacterium]
MAKLQKLFSIILLLFTANTLSAQVSWGDPRIIELENGNYQIELSATIDEGWKMYDMRSYEDGVFSTTFNFTLPDDMGLVGAVETQQLATIKWDEMFAQEIGSYTDNVTFTQEISAPKRGGEIKFNVEWMLCSDMSCMPPAEAEFSILIDKKNNSSSTLWIVIIEAILWGFAALLTPCVFPMVPMTVSFFMKGKDGGRIAAALYGLFIIALYTLPIAVIIFATYTLGGDAVTADIFNWIATHWFPNLLFFVVFMLFAASFFGAFEITLPSSWVNKSDSRADRNSIAGVFFLALTLVLVSFSCTGAIVGSVLIKSTSGEFWEPIITMLAFSSAFALPFVLLALFPSLLKNLPKSGGWLRSVKIVLGFLEIALGLKFLSVADQTYHWGILSRELYLAIWIVVFSLLGLYLLGKIRFSHDSKVETIGVGRLGLSIAVFSFVLYMLPGMWGRPLPALAGYLPPPSEVATTASSSAPLNDRFTALDEAQQYANSANKPLLVYFTGHGCVNCREMEQRVWSDQQVSSILEEYVVVKLYMDDKKELPESDWVTTDSGRVLKTIGRINSHLALERFGVNAQPYYILLGRNGEKLVTPRGYDLNIERYIKFLESGIRAYYP